jgi:hypothetical protein
MGWGEESVAHVQKIFKRLDPAVVTELNLRGFYARSTVLEDHHGFLADFHSKLRKLSFDYTQSVLITLNGIKQMKELTEVRATRIEHEPVWKETSEYYQSFFEEIPSHVRIIHAAPDTLERVERLNYNTFATDYVSLYEEKVIRYPSAKQPISGLSFAGKNIIGCEDGTIVIYKYDKELNTLTELSTNTTLHHGRINQITQVQQKIIIASSDCKVSVSDLNDIELVTVNVMSFPKPIYLILFLDTTSNNYLAAGKSTVYVSVDGKIVKQRSYDTEVTGMNYSTYGYDIATKNKYYHGPETLKIDEIDKLQDQSSTLETPNMSVSPDGSLRVTATKSNLALFDIAQCTHLYSVPGTYDDGANLQAYCPTDYWITASTGHAIWTLELETKQVILYFAPEVSAEDMRRGNFPTVRALWYEAESAALFALFSDNTLRWWKIELGPKSFHGLEKKRLEEASVAANANPNPSEGTDPPA